MVNFTQKTEAKIPEVNIGLVGHVDHGKTSLTQALTGKWTDTHSEELKRGITIRLGYADVSFYFCKNCKSYSNSQKCPRCFGDADHVRTVSFLDAPGHETLMATVLSGASLMDGAILVISADEECPQPQTAEHLKTLDVVGIKNIVIVQNKIDLVSEGQAIKHYNQIKKFVKGTVAENAPIIPISAIHSANIDILIESIEKTIPTPQRDTAKNLKFYVARSFDINRPGTEIAKLRGAVIGGSLSQGIVTKGQEIEIRPGAKINDKWVPLTTKIVEIMHGSVSVEEAKPGGLVALQTDLDPSLTRSDGLSGSIAGLADKMPPSLDVLKLKVKLFDYVIGVEGNHKVQQIRMNDPLLLTAAIAKTVGIVTSSRKDEIEIKLKLPVCVEKEDKVAIAMQISGRWHLIGYGVIV
ncbi:MAG: translation initiation factor IF-2 subunit gamma [Candidatus Aenigmarchaeota archaeon]|nr:translation initiation factor IF-2 subunit gamma [Candidatus Aenigmarchaeota archaeon]